ncbi:nitroreductase family protein [Pseudonocardia sp.]|uniref:nitroreductase family protein n=1 Tax=Pseudonocardia sp. TaxID=60912 RepID=UPI00260E6343|nr:nitroreductase family protein [Pseudonocardia sp.]
MTLPLGPDELLTTTRSVRKRLDLDRPVPLALVRESLEVAVQAPSGGNQQGWHWMVVTDPELRAGIGDYYRQSYLAYRDSPAYAGRAVPGREEVQARVASSADHLAEVMGRVPVHVIACITAAEELPASNQAGLWGSLLPAAWSFQVAARARGLGSAWTTLHLRYEREISALLGIPPQVRQGVLLPTAYYTGETFRPAKREPLDTVLHLDRW